MLKEVVQMSDCTSSVISAGADDEVSINNSPSMNPVLPILCKDNGPLFKKGGNVEVVFVLGGPGVGKGTVCSLLINKKPCSLYRFYHLSAGDLLREERAKECSKYRPIIDHYIKEGLIIPMQITISLLRDAMLSVVDKDSTEKVCFLIDGFPRNIEQGIEFEEVVCESKLMLFFDCDSSKIDERLKKRSIDSGRTDDNAISIAKRLVTFRKITIPVLDIYREMGKVRMVDSNPGVEVVYGDVLQFLKEAELIN